MKTKKEKWRSGNPPKAGWYEVIANHLDGSAIRAFGRDGQWWTMLGSAKDGSEGWMTSPDGYEWRMPCLADVDEDRPEVPVSSSGD